MTRKDGPEKWVGDSKKANKPLFSELDVLLRGLDRFFVAENFFISGEGVTARNFHEELATARDTILRILGILEVVIPESRKNSYWFQKFAEAKLFTTGKRDEFREGLTKQDSPEKGLYHLYDSFINLKGVISDLARSNEISYLGFMNIGRMISKGIRENIYFNPFRRALNQDFDVISNREITGIVKALTPREIKKSVSVIYLYLFRILRFTDFIDIETQRPVSLNASLTILVLLRSEIAVFQSYIEKTVRKIDDPRLTSLLESLAYQFSMETKRVYVQELKDIYQKKNSPQFRGRIENSCGILNNLTEQAIVQLTQFFRPDMNGADLFRSFVTKTQRSLQLREDIVTLHRIVSELQGSAGNLDKRVRAFETLRNYMGYFESFTFRLLRHDDYEEFELFFNELKELRGKSVLGPEFTKSLKRMAQFKIFLETTLRNIENRSELTDKSIDMERVEALMRQYS